MGRQASWLLEPGDISTFPENSWYLLIILIIFFKQNNHTHHILSKFILKLLNTWTWDMCSVPVCRSLTGTLKQPGSSRRFPGLGMQVLGASELPCFDSDELQECLGIDFFDQPKYVEWYSMTKHIEWWLYMYDTCTVICILVYVVFVLWYALIV